MVAISAADGTLLWVEGDRKACRKAEAMNFVPGADWSERGAGTNAPGTALVRATVVAVENHLALLRLTGPPADATAPTAARLSVLGSDRPRWQVTDEHGQLRATPLTGRHADILVLLSRHPEGLSADHLALLLDDKDLDVVTVRAEISRLRRVIGPEFIGSQPYRLLVPIASDVGVVFDALAAGDVKSALSHYSGPLLNQSVSPAIARLRTELSASLRGAVLATGRLALLRRWLEMPEGRDDRDGWRVLRDSAKAEPVTRAQASGHLAGLDFELG
jgi:hypothetical protein